VSSTPPATQGYVRLEHVSKRFEEVSAVDDVSLEIERGEIFCLLGASGCGKTTLLRLLAGFETPSGGRLLLDGQDLAALPPYRRPVNMMFQSYALFPHLSVARNVAFGLEQEGWSKAEIARRVAEMLETVKLSALAARKPHQLSGGQRQRVALARALVKRPKLLLLDEPLAALDRKLREHTQFELLNLQQQLGITCIVVTHDQEEAMTLANRIGVMNHGRLVQVGTPREIYECPATRFVADFVGSVNLFEGRLIDGANGAWYVQCPELPAAVRAEHTAASALAAVTAGAPLWVALRPERIRISLASPGTSENWARGVIHEVAYRGDASVFLVRLESGREIRVARANSDRRPEEQLVREAPVYLSWDSSGPVVGDH
jgi:putrescine transport system ATP-binding protein